eukprot:g5204.t1
MAAYNFGDKGCPVWTRDSPLTKKFIRLFYGILNSYPEHLHYFYGTHSRVVVSEFGPNSPPRTNSAETKDSVRDLLKTIYKGVKVVVKTAIPQLSVEEGVLLLVSGTFTRTLATSNTREDHCFTQALMLAPQKKGYYVLTDTLHVMNGSSSAATDVPPFSWTVNEPINGQSCSFHPVIKTSPFKSSTVARAAKINSKAVSEKGSCEEGPSGEDNPVAPTSPTISENPKSVLKEVQENETKNENEEKEEEEAGVTKMNKVQTSIRKLHTFQQRVTPPTTRLLGPNGRTYGAKPLMGCVGVPPGQSLKPRQPSGPNEPRHLQGPPGRGVFIARLPFGIQPEEVVKAFSIFGPIVNGADGIQVRDGRNGCYAFVTFESTNAAQAAIQNGAVVQGKRVFVEARNLSQESTDPTFAPMHVATPSSCVMPMHLPHILPTMCTYVRGRPN